MSVLRARTAGDDLAGQVAIVTGAGGEIGHVIAQDLARAGVHVAWVGLHEDSLRRRVRALRRTGQAFIVRADVRKESDVRRMVRAVLERFGRLDILVNNAAVRGPTAPVTRLPLAAWQEIVETNLTGPFLCARECLRYMTKRRYGRIVNISSMAGRLAYPLRAAYAASKWGLVGLTLTLAAEAGPCNVQVNAICPGPVEGRVMEDVMARRARALGTTVSNVRREFLRTAAMRRMVSAEDVSRAVLFLSSEAARNITGQAIEVSAGYHL